LWLPSQSPIRQTEVLCERGLLHYLLYRYYKWQFYESHTRMNTSHTQWALQHISQVDYTPSYCGIMILIVYVVLKVTSSPGLATTARIESPRNWWSLMFAIAVNPRTERHLVVFGFEFLIWSSVILFTFPLNLKPVRKYENSENNGLHNSRFHNNLVSLQIMMDSKLPKRCSCLGILWYSNVIIIVTSFQDERQLGIMPAVISYRNTIPN